MSSFVSSSQLYEKLLQKQDLILLDVRNREEFDLWNPFEAKNIPFAALKEKIPGLSRDKEIIIVCNRGRDSKKAMRILKKKGFKAACLTGGLKEWHSIYDISQIKPEKESLFAVYQVKRLGKGCLSYIVVSPNKKRSIIIDPGRHDKIYLDFIKKNKLKLVGVLDTHLHADHISGSLKLAKKLKIPYLLPLCHPEVSAEGSLANARKRPYGRDSSPGLTRLRMTDDIEKKLNKILKNNQIKVISTPGHTPESVAIILGHSFIFTGDTLFIDSSSRPDLTGDNNTAQNAKDLWQSIKKKLFALDDNYFVLPSHAQQQLMPGELMITATLRYIKRANEINLVKTVDDFVKNISSLKTPAPANHKIIKQINITGKIPKKDLDELELGANRCAASL